VAHHQIGFGLRSPQGGPRFYARHGGNASLLGNMVKDVRAAVDFLTCRSHLRDNYTMCNAHGYATSNHAIATIPYIDLDHIYVMGCVTATGPRLGLGPKLELELELELAQGAPSTPHTHTHTHWCCAHALPLRHTPGPHAASAAPR